MGNNINTKPFRNSTIPDDWEVMEFGEFTEMVEKELIEIAREAGHNQRTYKLKA